MAIAGLGEEGSHISISTLRSGRKSRFLLRVAVRIVVVCNKPFKHVSIRSIASPIGRILELTAHYDHGTKTTSFRSQPLAQQMLLLPALVTFLLWVASWTFGAATTGQSQERQVREFFGKDGSSTGSSHTNNWAVLVCASRYWFNYRVSISRNVYISTLRTSL
jgi:hypothetical protein